MNADHRRNGWIAAGFLFLLAAATAVHFTIRPAPSAAELAERQCITDVANQSKDDDEDAIEAQVAACNLENV